MNYTELNLNENLQKGLADAGYIQCTPVQEKVLQVSLGGADLYVQSQTGTGKTAAFLLTIMQELLEIKKTDASEKNALVLVPTRELAVQVEEEAKKLGKYAGLKFASFFGGVGYEEQISTLKKGVDIIIGTPGRVIDLQESKQMDLSHVAFLVTDEADRMFDMGFYPDLRKLIKVLPDSEHRQTMLFSATLNSYVKNLAYEYTKDAKEITIEAENITVDQINQELIHVESEKKLSLLLKIIQKDTPESLIIFCNTKKSCEILSKRLGINGIESEYIIGDLPQSKRQKIMDNFKAGNIKILVATDVAARGIDVNDLSMVVNYDLPNEAENYVHRIGRTARAGKSGKAYSFCGATQDDAFNLMGIEKYIEKKIPFIVATEEDYAEDKSRNVYIKLESEKKFEDKRASERTAKFDKKSAENGKSKANGGKNRKSSGKTEKIVQKSSDEEIERISKMTSDERAKYFREKYMSKSSESQKKSVPVKKESSSAGGFDRQKFNGSQKSLKSAYSKPNANVSSAKKDSKVAVRKTGIFEKIKALFGRK